MPLAPSHALWLELQSLLCDEGAGAVPFVDEEAKPSIPFVGIPAASPRRRAGEPGSGRAPALPAIPDKPPARLSGMTTGKRFRSR